MPDTAWLLLLFVVAVVGTVVLIVLYPDLFFSTRHTLTPQRTNERHSTQPNKAVRQHPTSPPKQAESAPRVLPPREWLTQVNDQPDLAPHLLVYAPTGLGKTWLVEAIIANRADQVVIITPKPKRDSWCGVPITTIDREGSYAPIEAMLQQILAELRRRLAAMHDGVDNYPPLTIVVDEAPRIRRYCASWPELFKQLAEIGRELRLRLITISTTETVKGLGIEGEGDIRENFVYIRLDRQRRGWIDWEETTYQIDLRIVPRLRQQFIPKARWWNPSEPSTEKADRLLSNLFETPPDVPVPANYGDHRGHLERTGTLVHSSTRQRDAVPAETGVGENTEGISAKLTSEAIRTLYKSWGSKNKIAALLTGTKAKRLEIIDAALAEEPIKTE